MGVSSLLLQGFLLIAFIYPLNILLANYVLISVLCLTTRLCLFLTALNIDTAKQTLGPLSCSLCMLVGQQAGGQAVQQSGWQHNQSISSGSQ